MTARSLFAVSSLVLVTLGTASESLALANRVFVSARSGNDANTCDNVIAPCQTFAGAVTKLNPDGEVIVLDSGGYGKVTITQGVTIEAPAGVTAFIHPTSGDAITVNAGSGTVTLRGLVLNNQGSFGNGIIVNSVGTLNVESCLITGFGNDGILMNSAGRLNVKKADVKTCGHGIEIANSTGLVQASIDHCHLDGNGTGYIARTTGGSTTTASNTTANNNFSFGWFCGTETSGKDVLSLEFCTGSENHFDGLAGDSANALSVARYSNCVFANNEGFGVSQASSGTVESRGNNTITGNGAGPTSGTIGTFPAM